MICIFGRFYDGRTSLGKPGEMRLSGDTVQMVTATDCILLPATRVHVENRLGNTPRRISWGEQASFVTTDNAQADKLGKALPTQHATQWVAWLEDRMAAVVVSTALALGAIMGFAVWGVPAIAERVAFATPQHVSDALGQTTLASIDHILAPSALSDDRIARLGHYFRSFDDVSTIAFRKAGDLGANAMTLSATSIVLTDELVALSDNDEELLAVYLHEAGHARLRHVERSMLQHSAWLVLFAIVTGDFGGASQLLLTVPLVVGQMASSREFERDADAYAVNILKQSGITPDRLATILERLEASQVTNVLNTERVDGQRTQGEHTKNEEDHQDAARKIFEYFSTHPATQERIRTIRQAVIPARELSMFTPLPTTIQPQPSAIPIIHD